VTLARDRANAYRKLVTDNLKAQRQRRLIVAAALMGPDQKILIQKRPTGKPMAGLWEFPGGKVEAGEGLAAGLVRELREELGINVQEANLEPFAFTSVAGDQDDLILLLYLIRHWQGEPQALIADELCWCSADQLTEFDMPPADVPLVTRLRQIL
jgi:8-oxo-dGTP diphosphatase